MTTRLTAASAGKSGGVLDLSDMKVVDADLPRVFAAVEGAYDGLGALILSCNYITTDGVSAHLAPFVMGLTSMLRIDLRGNEDINVEAEGALLDALGSLPAAWGCSIDARGTRLGGEAIVQLMNQTPEAMQATYAVDRERKRTATLKTEFEAKQTELVQAWKAEVDKPCAIEALEAAAKPWEEAEDKAFPIEAVKNQVERKAPRLKDLRAFLAKACCQDFDFESGARFAWQGALPQGCGTGQLVAHFSYLSCAVQPRQPEDFGFRLRPAGEVLGPQLVARAGAASVHAAVESKAVRIEAVTGKSYGSSALTLKLENLSNAPLCVVVPAGTVFQHISWIHRQNLLVGRTYHIDLAAGESRAQVLGGYCMNRSCSCSKGDTMQLTALLFEDIDILQSQGKIWDHFEGCFSRFREEAGYPDNVYEPPGVFWGEKKKKGKKGKKKG